MPALDNFILFDVAEAIITDKQSGEKFLNKFLTTSGISQTSTETDVRGGRGNALLAVVESEKAIEITMANAVVSKKFLEMQQGAEFKTDTVTIVKTEKVKLVAGSSQSDPATGTIVGTPLPTETSVTLTNCDGDSVLTTLTTKSFVVPIGFDAKAGDEITVLYKSEVVDAEVLQFDANLFPKGWELQLEVPAMDKCTGIVTHKVVFVFDNVRPSSAFDLSFAVGEPIVPEMTLRVMKSCCSDSLGRMAIVEI